MKEKLEKLMKEYKSKSKELIETVEKDSVNKIWGTGGGAPITIEPFRMELLGIKPGKILKNGSKPAKNRYSYDFDRERRIIYSKKYVNYYKEHDLWISNDDIYIYVENGVYRYNFQNVSIKNGDIARVVFIALENNKPIKAYNLEKNGEYTEKEYTYNLDRVVEINIRWITGRLDGHYRKFKINYDNEEIKIIEIDKNGEKQVYPEK